MRAIRQTHEVFTLQTVASIVDRLDMSVEQAIAYLTELGFVNANADTPLTPEQVDMLIDIDDDPENRSKLLRELSSKRLTEMVSSESSQRKALKRKNRDTTPMDALGRKEDFSEDLEIGDLSEELENLEREESLLVARDTESSEPKHYIGEFQSQGLSLIFDPGDAPIELLEDILMLIDALNRAEGGSGIRYVNEGIYVADGAGAAE